MSKLKDGDRIALNLNSCVTYNIFKRKLVTSFLNIELYLTLKLTRRIIKII